MQDRLIMADYEAKTIRITLRPGKRLFYSHGKRLGCRRAYN